MDLAVTECDPLFCLSNRSYFKVVVHCLNISHSNGSSFIGCVLQSQYSNGSLLNGSSSSWLCYTLLTNKHLPSEFNLGKWNVYFQFTEITSEISVPLENGCSWMVSSRESSSQTRSSFSADIIQMTAFTCNQPATYMCHTHLRWIGANLLSTVT